MVVTNINKLGFKSSYLDQAVNGFGIGNGGGAAKKINFPLILGRVFAGQEISLKNVLKENFGCQSNFTVARKKSSMKHVTLVSGIVHAFLFSFSVNIG